MEVGLLWRVQSFLFFIKTTALQMKGNGKSKIFPYLAHVHLTEIILTTPLLFSYFYNHLQTLSITNGLYYLIINWSHFSLFSCHSHQQNGLHLVQFMIPLLKSWNIWDPPNGMFLWFVRGQVYSHNWPGGLKFGRPTWRNLMDNFSKEMIK